VHFYQIYFKEKNSMPKRKQKMLIVVSYVDRIKVKLY